MSRPIQEGIARYAFSVAAVALAILVNLLLGQVEHVPSLIFLAAVTVVAWRAGLGPGLLATVLSALALDYLFVPNIYSLDLGPATWVWLATYLGVALVISWAQQMQRQLIASLREQNQRKTEFLAVIAHELRNHLAPVANAIAILKLPASDGSAADRALDAAERQVRNMKRLIDDMLDLARIGQGKLHLAREPADLRAIIHSAVDCAQPLVDYRHHRLKIALPNAMMTIAADATRIEQVLLNLLTNAAKYTEPGGEIHLSVREHEQFWEIRIRDNGIGIPPEFIPHVFDLFAQARPGERTGLGIGLNLVKRLVEMHGGSVTAHSDGIGCGSEFVVRFPQHLSTQTHGKIPGPNVDNEVATTHNSALV